MTRDTARSRRRLAWLASAAIALSVGVALLAMGVTPWVGPPAAAFCLMLGIAQRSSWGFAFAAAIVVELVAMSVMVRLTPGSSIGLIGGVATTLAVLGFAGLLAAGLARDGRWPDAGAMRRSVPVLALPLLLIGAVVLQSAGDANFEWAMHNDAVWNLVTARLIIEDAGIDTVSRPNSAPLTPTLMAIAAGVGRSAVEPQSLLRHDISRVSTLWAIGALTSALLAGLIGARAETTPARWVGAVASGVIPLTWFSFGFAAQYGFYNATLALVLLLAAWLAWVEVVGTVLLRTAVLSIAAVGLLATWAPLALLPFVLALLACGGGIAASVWNGRGMGVRIPLLLAILPAPIYVGLISIIDLGREGAALSADGSVVRMTPILIPFVVGATVAITGLNAWPLRQFRALLGVSAICLPFSVGLVYLLNHRAGAEHVWGYYPVKFAWLFVTLLLVILSAGVANTLASFRHRPVVLAGVVALAFAVPVTLLSLVPPRSDWVPSMLAPIAIVAKSGFASGAPAAQQLFDLAEPGRPTLVLSYANDAIDQFANSWLLQLESTTGREPIRTYSYFLRPGDEDDACDAVKAWGVNVQVVTTDETLGKRFGAQCRGADFTVDTIQR